MAANRSVSARRPSDGWPALGVAVAAGCLAATLAVSAQDSASAVDRAFQSFWSAPHANAAAARIGAIVKTGVSFEDALTRIRHGREYDADVPRGLQFGWHRTFDGIEHEYVFVVPREPLPDTISWQTERVDRFHRAHWLIIDRLGSVDGESRLPDTNLLGRGRELDFGLRISAAVDRGRRAHEVIAGSNAFQIGLRAGDRFVEINGTPVETGREIAHGMETWVEGEPLRFVIERRGDRMVLEGIYQPAEIDMPPTPMFPRRKSSGRVDLTRRGNVVEASTEGVRAFTLLLSPSIFDFRRPVTVVANGRTVFDGMVEPSVATMLKWAARDNDRTMVFGAELNIALDK